MISIIICTYNREEILREVLTDLFENVNLQYVLEVLLIDNNSTDNTKKVVLEIQKRFPKLKYIFEEKQGLSHARNRGADEITSEFAFYLDDDALCDKYLFNKICKTLINEPKIKVLGGIYIPWYRYGKPHWFKDEYASKSFRDSNLHILPTNDYLSGSNMLFHRSIFQKIGYFNPDLGMNEDKVFYGEETEFQQRIRNKGIDIYADDNLIVRHVVQEYKLNVEWFLKQKKALGETLAFMYGRKSLIEAVKALVIGTSQGVVFPVINALKMIRKDYYIENWRIDSFSKPLKWFIYAKNVI